MSVRRTVRKKTTNVRHTGYDMPPVGGVTRSQQQQAGGAGGGDQVDPAVVPLVDQAGGDGQQLEESDHQDGLVIVGNSQQAGGSGQQVWAGSPPHPPFPGTNLRSGVSVGRGGGNGGTEQGGGKISFP